MILRSLKRAFLVLVASCLAPHATAGYGDLDTSFGVNGVARVDSGTMNEYTGHGIAVLPDGKILVSGSIDYVQGAFVARLNPNGSLDTTFGTGGKTMLGHRAARTLLVQPDGKILVGLWGWGAPGQMAAVVARLDSEGSMDTSWGQGGFAITAAGLVVGEIVLQPDGKVLASSVVYGPGTDGNQYPRIRLLRFNGDGTLDPSFGTGGIFAYDPPGNYDQAMGGLLLASSGRIHLGTWRAGWAFDILGITGNGVLDPSWGDGGVAHSPFTNYQWSFNAILVEQADGKILTAGECRLQGSCVERYNVDGSFDTSFGSGGRGDYTLYPDYDGITTMHRVAGGGIFIAGYGYNATTYTRHLLANGQPDARYFNNSLHYIPFTPTLLVNESVRLADNSVVFVGQQVNPNISRNDLVVFRIQGDAVAPETTITSGPPQATTQDSATFAFSADDANATFECRLNGGAAYACTSPVAVSQLPDGANTFSVAARDLAGNLEAAPASWSWSVDHTAPETSITSGPPPSTNQPAAQVTFTASEAGSTFECSLDGASFAACTSPAAYTGLAEGAHSVAVRARDAAGNVDASPASHSWTVDTTPPDTSITAGPPSPTSNPVATFSYGSSGAASFECSLDGGAWAPCAPSYAVAHGSHSLAARAVDPAGNVDPTPASWNWTVDMVGPDMSLLSAPSGTVATRSASIAFSSPESGATFECTLDGGGFAPCTSPVTLSGLADGEHGFGVRARDALGNIGATPVGVYWTVDATAPDTGITASPPAATNSTTASFAFTASEPGSTFECKLDAGAYAACTSPRAYSGLAQGSHTFSVRARDAVGNQDATAATFTWTVDTTPPNTTIASGPSGGNNTNPVSFTFTSNEAGATFECSLDGTAFAACASGVSYTGLAKGQHSFRVRARDAAGNVDASPASRSFGIK